MPKKKGHSHYYMQIKDHSKEDRPREKLIAKGRTALTKAELLGLLIGSGIQHMNAVDLARQVLKEYNNNLGSIAKLTVKDLTRFRGIGDAKATLIVAALELGTRLQTDLHVRRAVVRSGGEAYHLMKDKLANKLTEEFWIIMLNSRSEVIKVSPISVGGISRTIVDNKVLFRESLLNSAVAIILVHNHPSGDPTPSSADMALTRRVISASKSLNINVLDHIIYSDTSYFSFSDEGLIDDEALAL